MHIHGNQMILNAVNPYSAAAEKAAAAQRAAHLRRMRRKRTAEAAGTSSAGVTYAVGSWMHSEQRSEQRPAEAAGPDGVEYRPSVAGADSSFE
jgi:hypothetical protein